MTSLVAEGPAGTVVDPFGGHSPGGSAEADGLAFPAEQFTAAGMTEQELADSSVAWAALDEDARLGALSALAAASPEELAAVVLQQRADRLSLPSDRYLAAGATEDEVVELDDYFDGLGPAERIAAYAYLADLDDEGLAYTLETWRKERDASAATGALQATTETETETPSGDEAAGGGSETTPEPSPEPSPEQPTETPDEAPTETPDEAPAEEPETSTEQSPEETETFTSATIGGLNIDKVMHEVGSDPALAQQALDAELGRGEDDARVRLIGKLREIIAPST